MSLILGDIMFEDEFKPATEKERLERAFLAQAAKLIVDKAWFDVDWEIYFRMLIPFFFIKIKNSINTKIIYNIGFISLSL